MQTIRLKTGKEYSVNWCGVADIDGILRAEIVESTFCDIAQVFCKKENTEEITYIVNGTPSVVFDGYTKTTSIISGYGGIVVSLQKETT